MHCSLAFRKLQCSCSLEEGFEVYQTIALEQGYAFCSSWENLPKLGKLASLWENLPLWVLSGESRLKASAVAVGARCFGLGGLCGVARRVQGCAKPWQMAWLLTCPRWWAVREQYRGSAKWQWFFCHPPLRGRRCCGQRGSNGLSCSAGEGGGELRAGSGCRDVELLAWEPFLVLQWCARGGGSGNGGGMIGTGSVWGSDCQPGRLRQPGLTGQTEQQEEIGPLNQKAREPGTGRQLI